MPTEENQNNAGASTTTTTITVEDINELLGMPGAENVMTPESGKKEEANKLILEAKNEPKDGYFINEDNAIYETYPYQVRWK